MRLHPAGFTKKVAPMQYRIITIGKPALDWARDGVADYLRRLQRYTKAELQYLKEGTPAQNSERLLKASEGCLRGHT